MSRARDNANLSPTIPDARMPNLTGDITTVEGAVATTIANDAVTGAKIENNPTIAGNLTVSGDIVPSTPLSHRNMIINGGMTVWQRGTASTALSNSNTYVPDRFNCRAGVGSGHTAIRSTDVPTTGEASFTDSLKFTVGTGGTVSSTTGNNYFYYAMEGYDSNPTKIGTAYAKIMTISFWVKASVTGAYGFAVTNDANDFTYAATYTVSSADTWEKKTITIPVSGTGGTAFNTTNGRAITLIWNWGAGSNFTASGAGWTAADDRGGVNSGSPSSIQLVDGTHNGATWFITGVQLELGSNATPFEHRSYGDELARCQRYFWAPLEKAHTNRSYVGIGLYLSSSKLAMWLHCPVDMRSVPTLDMHTGTDRWSCYRHGSADYFDQFSMITNTAAPHGKRTLLFERTSNVGSNAGGEAGAVSGNNTACYFYLSSEL